MDIVIDWAAITTQNEFYDRLLAQLSAPKWHGRNLEALSDSISVGDINGVEPPYRIVICGSNKVQAGLAEFAHKVSEVVSHAAKQRQGIEVACFETQPGVQADVHEKP